jgi:hypothetical protein
VRVALAVRVRRQRDCAITLQESRLVLTQREATYQPEETGRHRLNPGTADTYANLRGSGEVGQCFANGPLAAVTCAHVHPGDRGQLGVVLP